MKVGKSYTNVERDYARYLYSIKGKALTVVAKERGISLKTLNNWKKKHGWLGKGEEAHVQQSWNTQMFLEEAAKQGMDLKKAIGIQIDGMTKPTKIILDRNGCIVSDEPDYSVMQKFTKDFWTLSGLLGGKGLDVNANDGSVVNIMISHPGKE